MSDMLNHYCCGRDALKAMPEDSAIKKIILENYDAYRLGTQGPDFFYYHHPMPWNPLRPLHRYGNKIHKTKIDAFFYFGFQYALNAPKDKNIILSYLAGFSCHHSLDVASHPYIFYLTGHCDAKAPGSRVFSYYHKYFEVLLDVAYYQYEYQKLACFFPLDKLFTPRKKTVDALEAFYSFIMACVYNEPLQRGCVADTLQDTAELARFFGDPRTRKKRVVRAIEKLIDEEKVVSRVFYPLFTDELTVLNLANHPWKHPCTGEVHSESYPQLFKQAVAETTRKLTAIDSFMDLPKGPTPEIIGDMYHNLCYDTGLPANAGLDMQYFDIIFDHYPQL
ncbi:MAG: hypothetical protein Q4C55_06315 [Eubacterium sp.]|nr:hypothetical protein [Eubacterium sp.]